MIERYTDDKNFNFLMENNFDEIDSNSLIYQNYKYFLVKFIHKNK